MSKIRERRRDLLALMWRCSVGGLCTVTSPDLGTRLGRPAKSVHSAILVLKTEGAIIPEHEHGRPGRWRMVIHAEDYDVFEGERIKILGGVKYDWTFERFAALPDLWAAGYTVTEIAERLGFPREAKNSIISKVHRMGLPGRESPIKYADGRAPPKAKPARIRMATLPKLPSAQTEVKFDYAALPRPIVVKPSVVKTQYVKQPPKPVERPMLIDFRSSTPPRPSRPRLFADDDDLSPMGPSLDPCQWIVRDGSVTVPWVHCGIDIVPTKQDDQGYCRPLSAPYCAYHRKIAYYKVPKRDAA